MKQRLLFFALLISTSILHGQAPADALPALATRLTPAARPGLGPRLETGKDAMAPNAAAPKGGRKAAGQGHEGAPAELGRMHCDGNGATPSAAEAVNRRKKAVQNGSKRADPVLGCRRHRPPQKLSP